MAKILIVDDTPDVQELLTIYLSHEGYTIITAVNGMEGLDRAAVNRPDLIITDLHMPGMHGVQFIQELRSRSDFATLPILGFTAFGRETAEKALEAGANHVLQKPIDFDEVVILVKRLLSETSRPLTD